MVIKPHPDGEGFPQWNRAKAADEFERLFQLICKARNWNTKFRTYQRYFAAVLNAIGGFSFDIRIDLTDEIDAKIWDHVKELQETYEEECRAEANEAWRQSFLRSQSTQRQSFQQPSTASGSTASGSTAPRTKAPAKSTSSTSTSSAVGKCWGCAQRDHKWAECTSTNKSLTRVNNMPFDVEVGLAYCLQFNQGKDCSATDHVATRRSDRCTVCQSKTHGLHNHA